MFRFTLYDFTNSDGQTGVEIEEPIGFDGLILGLSRHKTYKGVNFELSLNTIQIYDKVGFQIVKSAYDTAGVNAIVRLKVEYECSDGFDVLFESQLNMEEYREVYDDYCAIDISIEPTNYVTVLKKNEDVKVDLEALKGFDGVTNLLPYEYLGKEIELPSKTIQLKDLARASSGFIYTTESDPIWVQYSSTGYIYDDSGLSDSGVGLFIPLDINVLQEVGEFVNDLTGHILEFNGTDTLGSILDLDESEYIYKHQNNFDIECTQEYVDVSFKYKALVEFYTEDDNDVGEITANAKFYFIKKEVSGTESVILSNEATKIGGREAYWNYDVSYSDTLSLNEGDRLYFLMRLYYNTNGNAVPRCNFRITMDGTSFFQVTALSLCEPTNCKQFLLNESFSRIAESVTNDKIRVFSNYLGRTDAQPYTSSTDGLASLKAITKGLFIRQVEKVKENKPIFSVSFKELFQAIDAIDNIGLCFETDVNRPSYQVARIENIDYFFKDEVILDIGEVKLKRDLSKESIYNIFKFGYQKYEAEEYNGLDEFLTKREFRTDLITKNTLEKLCSFIASGYAIEITRRKGNDTSKDWRYDEDTFIVCMKRDGEIVVEQGGIIDDENIIDPSTILNYRISPIRNAMRWIREVFRGYKDQTKAKLIFSSGDGNYYAKGLYTGNILESSAVAENDTITQSSLANLASAMPYISSELDNIQDIGLTYNEYKLIRANPHALIGYSVNRNQQYGYIQDLKYSVLKGNADFLLIPKY